MESGVVSKRPVPQVASDDPTAKTTSTPGAESESLISGPTLTPSSAGVFHFESVLPPLDETRYVVASELGKGGQGTVWKAHDRVLRREVAVKRLHPELMKEPALVANFLREARLTASLQHAGIVPLHDVGLTADGVAAIVLRRVEGRSLAELLTDRKTLEERLTLVPALLRACQAVAYAHERHVVHRDLKPQNIMLGALGETTVLDWGLALVKQSGAGAPDSTAPHGVSSVVGTPAYMSPEQALGLDADARSDVWGLGACLYQLLTGAPPIGGRSVQSALGHAAAAEISPVLAVQPDVPRDLAAICEKCLQSERSERYPSAVALAADLERWLTGRAVSARSYSRLEVVRRAVTSNPVTSVAVALGLVLLAVLLVVNEVRVRRERNEARTFARELLRDLPDQLDTESHNIELATFFSERANAWLQRGDLSSEELSSVCEVILRLAAFHEDIGEPQKAQTLAEQALALVEAHQSRFADPLSAFHCRTSAMVRLGELAIPVDPARATRLFEEARVLLEAWPGTTTVAVEINKAWLYAAWGAWLWESGDHEGLKLMAQSFEVAERSVHLASGVHRQRLLGFAANGMLAVWVEQGRTAAFEAARRNYERQRDACGKSDINSLRACLAATQWYALLAAWEGDPVTAELRKAAGALTEKVLARDSNSHQLMFDSLNLALESNELQLAADRAEQLKPLEVTWVVDVGPFALFAAGRLDRLEAWKREVTTGTGAGPLGYGLGALARGRYQEAADDLARVAKHRVWQTMSWPPDGQPKVEVPEAIRPAYDAFLRDFTTAMGTADFDGLDAAVERLRVACLALAN
jgi:serine/threonine protein kinase